MAAGDRFVEVPSAVLFKHLEAHGFTDVTMFREVVYQRVHHIDPRYKILIYTSVARGATTARACGADAIRVAPIVLEGFRSRGIAKLPRILRTGSVEAVFERVIERAREAYAICNEHIRRGAPRGGLPRHED